MQFDCKYSKDFTIMTFKTYLITIFIFITAVCNAGPARPGVMTFTQPDGSSFAARVRGDEFMKIITTSSGNAIVKNDDGWWCYATYDSKGQKIDSGYRVGISSGNSTPFTAACNAPGPGLVPDGFLCAGPAPL